MDKLDIIKKIVKRTKLDDEQMQTRVASHYVQQSLQGGPMLDKGKRIVEIEFWGQNS